MTGTRTILLTAALVAAPALATAQRPQPPMPPMAPAQGMQPPMGPMGAPRIARQRAGQWGQRGAAVRQPGVTRLLNLRRQLDLTPRQVTQLDSIERALFAERKALLERLQGERRALQQQRQGRPMPPDSLRARMLQLQPQLAQWRQRDSLAMAAAERLLTEPQRQKLREIRAYARGRADALRQSRGPQGGQPMMPMRPLRPIQGMPRGDQDVDIEIRRQVPGGEEVRIERRTTRPPR